MPETKADLEEQLDQMSECLDSISELAEEALDPELTREELVSKVKEIADLADSHSDDDDGDEDDLEDDDEA